MIADIQKLEAAARLAMGDFELSGNSPVKRRSLTGGRAVVLAVLAVAAIAVAVLGTF